MSTARYEFRVGEYLTSEVHLTEGLSWDTRKEMLASALLFALDYSRSQYQDKVAVEVRAIVRACDQNNAARRSLGRDS